MQQIWELDLATFRWIHQGLHQPWLDPVFLVFSYMGLGQVQVAAVLLVCWLSRAARPYWPYLLGAFATAGLANTALKRLFARERPSLLEWSLPQEPFQYSSFPSGHSVTSFALASLVFVLVWQRGGPRWAAWLALVWALTVGISRVYRGVHWPTDVLGAAGLGLIVGASFGYLAMRRTLR